MDHGDVSLGGDRYISKLLTLMQTNLNGPWVTPRLAKSGEHVSILQAMPRHKHLVLTTKRFNVSLLGI